MKTETKAQKKAPAPPPAVPSDPMLALHAEVLRERLAETRAIAQRSLDLIDNALTPDAEAVIAALSGPVESRDIAAARARMQAFGVALNDVDGANRMDTLRQKVPALLSAAVFIVQAADRIAAEHREAREEARRREDRRKTADAAEVAEANRLKALLARAD